jgi:hypothetical protein
MTEAVEYTVYFVAPDTDTLCPTTDRACVALESIVDRYTDPVSVKVDSELPDQVRAKYNGPKMAAKLIEHKAQARLRSCPGEVDGACPTRRAMDESAARKVAVSGIRGIISTTSNIVKGFKNGRKEIPAR